MVTKKPTVFIQKNSLYNLRDLNSISTNVEIHIDGNILKIVDSCKYVFKKDQKEMKTT